MPDQYPQEDSVNSGSRTPAQGRVSAARRALLVSGVVLVLPLLGMPGSAAGVGGVEGACPVVAVAQGAQSVVSASNNLLLQAPTGATAPVAQACVDYAISESSGFASNPYPGETVLAAPAIVRGATELPVPDYPAYAASRYPSANKSKVDREAYSLSSRSSETSTTAHARTGVGQDGAEAGWTLARASATVDPDAKTATAAATSDTRPVSFNDVLELGRTRSIATAKVGADGKIARTSELSIGRTVVAGQVVEITPEGVKAVGKTAPTPAANPAEQLESAGIHVRYLTEKKTQGGVLAAGIEVVVRHTDAETGDVYTAEYTFGRAFAAAAPVVARNSGDGVSTVPIMPAEPPSAEGSAPAADGTAVASPAPDGDPGMSAPVPAEAPLATAPDSAPAPAVAAPARMAGRPVDFGLAGVYLVLIFGALAMVVSGTLLRLLGVRTRWTA